MSDYIKIDVSRDKLKAAIRILSVDQPTRDEIVQALKKSGVVYGVFEDVVDLCASAKPTEAVIIAKGDPPVPGKNGWVELLWEKKEESDVEPDSAQTVDYRETSKLISVNEGTLLAQRFPPQNGEAGKAVTGEVIMPPQPKEARIVAGKGVRLDTAEDRAYSTIQGRPVAKVAGTTFHISVEPSYTVTGDVCMKTGNIRFKGDVIVTGSVTETMTLEASGNVRVGGIVTGARVLCGESLLVQKNVISSDITAGIGSAECGKIKYLIQDIYTDLTNLIQLIEQLREKMSNAEKLSFSVLVNGIIENRFKNLRANAKQLVTTKTFNLPFEVADAVESVKILTGLQFTQEDFKEMMHNLAKAVDIMNSQESQKARVTVNSAHGSTIKCSGEVVVTGKGCVNTTIYAGGDVKITGPFKGGEIFSEGNVEIDELGSNLGAPPLVRVKSKNIVKVKKTLPGSIIQVGSRRINISRELTAARYRLSEDGDTVEIV
ncbi:MAG: FapA family protein [Peptococcaceae bacterium]|nr:FapA family protein [Peptococcaceae bacterium]